MPRDSLEPMGAAIDVFFAAAATATMGGDPVAITVGAASPLAERAAKAAIARIQHVREAIMREFARTLAEIADWATQSDERMDFMIRLLEASRRAGLESKRMALGRVAERALTDDAALDECLLFIEALDDFESIHISVLTKMSAPRPGVGQLEGHLVTGEMDFSELSELVPGPEMTLRASALKTQRDRQFQTAKTVT